MKKQEAQQLQGGEPVEIRYIGRGEGIVLGGTVKSVWSDGEYIDVILNTPPYGVKFGVPSSIVHHHIRPPIPVIKDHLLLEPNEGDDQVNRQF
jgi:hypothetical protein